MEKEVRFRPTLAFAIGMLLIQYLLGLVVNLFVTIPENHPGARPSEYFGGVVQSVTWAILHGGLWLTLHGAFGLVLLIGAIGTLVQAIRLGGGGRITWSAVGLFAVVSAGFNGGSFLNYNQDYSSMLMAIGWALAMTSYVVLLYRGATKG
jgi:hypothetical protein